jgi:hypothetical protein
MLFDCSSPRITGYVYPSQIVKHIYLVVPQQESQVMYIHPKLLITTSSFSWQFLSTYLFLM